MRRRILLTLVAALTLLAIVPNAGADSVLFGTAQYNPAAQPDPLVTLTFFTTVGTFSASSTIGPLTGTFGFLGALFPGDSIDAGRLFVDQLQGLAGPNILFLNIQSQTILVPLLPLNGTATLFVPVTWFVGICPFPAALGRSSRHLIRERKNLTLGEFSLTYIAANASRTPKPALSGRQSGDAQGARRDRKCGFGLPRPSVQETRPDCTSACPRDAACDAY
jgi:hypothetical protein